MAVALVQTRDTLVNLALDSTEQLLSIVNPPQKPPRVIRVEEEKEDPFSLGGKDKPRRPWISVEVLFETEHIADATGNDDAESVGSSTSESDSDDGGEEDVAVEDAESGEVVEEQEEADDSNVTLRVSPSCDVVKTAVGNVLQDAMTVISAPPRLLTHPDLAPYTQAANEDAEEEEEPFDIVEMVHGEDRYVSMSEDILKSLDAAFMEVAEYCTVFNPYRSTYLKNQDSLEEVEGTFHGADLEVFEQAIAKYKAQSGNFEEIPRSADIGILFVDSSKLKLLLLPSPQRCLAAIRELIPRFVKDISERLVEDLRGRLAVLEAEPADVEQFVGKVAMLEKTQSDLEGLKDRELRAKQLAELMENNHWPLPDTQRALFTMLRKSFVAIDKAMQAFSESLEADVKRFAADIEQQVPRLKSDLLSLEDRLKDPLVSSEDSDVRDVVNFLDKEAATMKELKSRAERFQRWQRMLKVEQQEFETLENVEMDLGLKQKLWQALQEWEGMTAKWQQSPFRQIDAEAVNLEVAKYNKVAVRSERMLPDNGGATRLKALVDDFKSLIPVVSCLRNKSLKERHWEEIEEIINHKFDPEREYTLGALLELNVVTHEEAIQVVSTKAVQEAALEDLMQTKVKMVWGALEFIVNPYKESKDVFILGSVEDVTAALDDSLVTISTVLGSRFCAPIREEVESWQRKLMYISETLDEWLTCQKQWMYLETIFAADDIKRQLPEESKRFANVDKAWKSLMKKTNANPKVIDAGTTKGLKEMLVRHNETLDGIQKSLEDYLETKRSAFPRFYFLSNEELLEILAQTRDPQAVQPHLRKCFDALNKLEFGSEPGSVDIVAMFSGEGERIALPKSLKARGNVEDWLGNVEAAMRQSLRKLLKSGWQDYDEQPRKEWVMDHAGQVVSCVSQIMWCRGTEAALLDPEDPVAAMRSWYETNVLQLAELTELVRGQLTKLQRKVVVTLVTTDVHARDIVERLAEEKVSDIGNFTWQQQLRFYWDRNLDGCLVRQSNSEIEYGYEYQGCTSRLVITPLTDRCWMTITGAVNLKLGAAPAGPAGTGKTESSKDLAKALAIQCIVFNCSEQIDYKMMGKLFSGLAQSGAWTCLDEFNRIDIEVLSVVAQQLLQLRQGILQGLTHMDFEGRHIALKQHCVIITMNPGYAGRTELPDNLKILFRPMAMMVPDYGLIAEIILFAEGFDDARNLSRKMVRLYRLSSEQLSQQRHYDFGMRAVKSVLVMAGALKRNNPDLSEDVVLIRAMRDSNIPKFLRDDLPLFHAIVGDLFPGVEVPHNETGALEAAITKQQHESGLQPVPGFTAKILQLFETFNVRFGVVLVGPTGGGKTSIYRVLAKAMTQLKEDGVDNEAFQRVHMQVLNPKCISMGELYGEFNELTQEWTDGLASTIIRGFVEDETPDRRWTVFDGPIDALWIENMNTVLDDNMMLCLANGERIKLKPAMRMLFEVQDLEVASPATVSRLGVVFVTPQDLGWLPYVQSWAARDLPKDMRTETREHLLSLFESTVDEGLQFQRKNCTEPISTVDVQQATSLCNLFTALITSAKDHLDWKNGDEAALRKHVDSFFAFSYVWSLGGSIAEEGFDKFDNFVRGLPAFNQVRFGAGSVYDVFVDVNDAELPWRKWQDVVPEFVYSRDQPYFYMVVPTLDTVRYSFILKQQVQLLNPVFLTGVTGTGKTVIVSDYLNTASDPDYTGGVKISPVNLNFSAQTSSLNTQSTIESKLEKKKKTLLGAPVGKSVVIFVDDVNMPAVEEYGAQPPIELLRQFCDFKGMYDRHKLFWKDVADTVLVASAAPPGGGRAEITKRFTRHFHMMCVPPATDAVLTHIFGSILSGFLEVFPAEVKALATPMTKATVDCYNAIRKEMKPTPAKSHYTFNLRDVSKVFQGILMIGPKECQNADVLLRLWAHESMRVFHDRLTTEEDKAWFTQSVVGLLKTKFSKAGDAWSAEALFGDKPVIFADFLRPKVDDDQPGIYEEAKSLAQVVRVLEDALEDYNATNPTQMKLVFFRDAVEHVCRIARILRQPRGNAMLVGVGGSGKQSLTRMACALCDVKCSTIELTRGYGINEFREDLKAMMLVAGAEGKQIAFLFTDTQIVNESFLEDVNNVLNTGEVPNLFAMDEVTKIIDDVRPAASALGIPETRDNVWRLFVSRVRDNLHIVLAMSPVGDALRVRCRQFPSLINCTTIDWYMPWPDDALLSVAMRFLNEEEALGDHDVKEEIAGTCVKIHQSVSHYGDQFFAELQRKVYTTPKSYLDLINLYLGMLKEKQEELGKTRGRLAIGVQKLEETNEVVAGLKEELTKLQPVLDEKAKETEELLKQVSVEQKEAEKIKVKVESEEKIVRKQADEVRVVQAEAQADLDVALPALNDAIAALDALDKKDITEVKSFAKPPPAVQLVMEAVCILLGEKPNWDNSKKLLASASFMQDLKDYDKENIPPATLKKLKSYLSDPTMAVENVKKVSKAATSLCMWVHAMDVYAKVAKEVEPKKKRLEEMNAQLNAAEADLKEKQDQLQEVLDKVNALQEQCDRTVAEKERLAHEAQLTKNRLTRAGKLTSGLADEQVRWKASVKDFDAEIRDLTGDVLLAAGCVSYYGAFTGKYRERMVEEWLADVHARKIPASKHFSLMKVLGSPVQLRKWHLNGLPTDDVSGDSAVLVTRGKRWPLMIDPQEQAKRWVKNMEAANNLAITRLSNPNMLRTLENCIRIGRPLLLEDIGETLDPALEPVLARAVFKNQGRLLIHLGDSDVDYDENFKLYLSTKLPNPHYLPEVCIKVTVINFTVTLQGLEDQLLGDVVVKEAPQVEEKKNKLLIDMANFKSQLKDLEDKILRLLSESQGNILDDEELIRVLGESKEVSKDITIKLQESEKTNEEITKMRNLYRPAATRGSIIYFVIADLARVDPMYQFSLSYFKRLYNMCIDDSEKSSDLETRLNNLMSYMTANVYSNVCRGLFEEHKLMFSFLICVQIMRNEGTVRDEEWLLLLRGAGMTVNKAPNPLPDLIPELGWNLCEALEESLPEQFEGFIDSLRKDAKAWRQWMTTDEPQTEPLPSPWNDSLNGMQKLLVLKVAREEKVVFAIKDFVANNLGKRFVESPPVSMADIHADTDCSTPVVFILSVGADPTGLLLSFAKQRSYSERLHLISLGQGQGPRARALIERAVVNGDWVLLQNCHLAKSWMPELEKIVEMIAEVVHGKTVEDDAGEEKGGSSSQQQQQGSQAPVVRLPRRIHPDFRLYLTSMPATYFPVPVLQNGVKLTNEPPKGIRANVSRSLANLDNWSPFEECEGEFADGSPKIHAWKRLAFGLTFFHSIIQERRKFGPLGWNIRYEFNDSDLESSLQVLKMFLTEQPTIPWDALQYVTGQINYGGRVTDDWDRRCLMGILSNFYTPDILKPDYKLSPSGVYRVPEPGPLSSYREYVDQLPLNDPPEIFGMHENANITFQAQETENILKTCLSIQPRSSGAAAGSSPEAIVSELAAEIEAGLPGVLKREEAGKNTFVYRGEHMDSLATVLSQEMARYNKLLRVMAQTLSDLQRAIRGEVLMSDELDRMFTRLLNNQVPGNWEAVGYASLKPLASWVKDLHERVKFMHDWLVHGRPGVFWMSGFFFPQGFLTGTLQNHARKYKLPIDTLAFKFNVLDADAAADVAEEDVPEDGVLVSGLFMDGARWDKEAKLVSYCCRHTLRTSITHCFVLFVSLFRCTCVL